jgi:DNA-binding NarL/FixJ family response regulator
MPRASHSVHPLIRPAAEVLDEVYRVDRPTDEWLRGLSSIRVFDPEGPPLAWILKNEAERWSLVAHDDGPGLAPMMGLRDVWENGPLAPPKVLSGGQSETIKMWPLPEPYRTVYTNHGFADVWAMFARSADNVFVGVTRCLPKRVSTSPRVAKFWSSVSIHIATAARLRASIDRREAVLQPDGKIVHAEGIARASEDREALRLAARAIDRARVNKEDPLGALEAWTAMVRGRWTLIDEHESDGRRFLIARVNEPKLPPSAQLSSREAHVLALVKLGRSNKAIAYELGVSTVTVATFVARIRSKLGQRRRAELLE